MKVDRKKLAWFLTNIRHNGEKDNVELTDTDIANQLGTWIERNPGCIDIHGVSDAGRFHYSTVGYGVFSLMGENKTENIKWLVHLGRKNEKTQQLN